MADISAALVFQLRKATDAPVVDCKAALTETDGDFDKAIEYLEIKKKAKASKKMDRIAAEGKVESYIHAGGRIGVLVEVNCETDFAAKADAFNELVKDLCLHIAACNPHYVTSDEIPESVKADRRAIYLAQTIEEGKPEKMLEKITDGKLNKWLMEASLLDQPFVKNPDVKVREHLLKISGGIGEKIAVRRFVRFELGEGLEKRKENFAEDVAAAQAAAGGH